MPTPEERALLTDIGDKLLQLYAKRDEALHDSNFERLQRLEVEITETVQQRKNLLHSIEERI